jgi:hypothetical protein
MGTFWMSRLRFVENRMIALTITVSHYGGVRQDDYTDMSIYVTSLFLTLVSIDAIVIRLYSEETASQTWSDSVRFLITSMVDVFVSLCGI